MGDKYGFTQHYLCTLFEVGVVGNLTDADLLGRYASRREGDAEWAFAALVERHGPMVLRVCLDVTRDEHAAEDAFQAAFLLLARRAGALWVRESLGPWLHEVAFRIASRARADASRRKRHERRATEMRGGLTDDRSWDDQEAVVHREIERLPARYRAPLVLCYLEGLTTEQAAQRLGWPVGTVRSRLARGRERLKGRLVRLGFGPADGPSAMVLPATLAGGAVSPALIGSAVRAGVQSASGGALAALACSAAILFKGGMKAMMLAKFKAAALALIVGAVSLTAAFGYVGLASQGGEASEEARDGSTTKASDGRQAEKKAMTEEELKSHREARGRILKSMKRLELALFDYQVDKGHYPPAAIKDKDGRSLLSWRVAVLPYLGEGDLFREFKLDEPWDGPHNKPLMAKVPDVFAPPKGAVAGAYSTPYQAVVGPGTAWEPGKELIGTRDFPDGTNNTIQLVEAYPSVPWTKPEDVVYAPGRPLPKFGCLPDHRRFWAGFVDGHCRDYSWADADREGLQALITRNGGD